MVRTWHYGRRRQQASAASSAATALVATGSGTGRRDGFAAYRHVSDRLFSRGLFLEVSTETVSAGVSAARSVTVEATGSAVSPESSSSKTGEIPPTTNAKTTLAAPMMPAGAVSYRVRSQHTVRILVVSGLHLRHKTENLFSHVSCL